MSISYNYFLPTNIYGTLRVVDLGFPGYTAVNANIYCQRNINCDGQLQCGQFHSLGTAYFDQVPTCITNATTATQLTNYQTVQALVAGGGGSSILGLNNTWTGTNTFNIPIVSSGASITVNTIPALAIVNASLNQTQIATGFLLVSTTAQSFTGIKTFSSPIVSSGASITANTIPALSIVNASINQTQIATGFLLVSTLGQNFTGIKTFLSPIVSSGASITANTIPALSIVNASLTNTQVATGFQLVSTSAQTFSGIKTFSSAIVSSGESLTTNTIPATSLVNNSITDSQIASGFQLVSTGSQTFSGNKIFNGTAVTNEMIINIPSAVSSYFGSIGFIPACTANYLNLTTELFDSMMFIGQPIANGINQPYGFTIGDYNSLGTGIRISGNGSAGNCGISLNGSVLTTGLLTCNNGLFINLGNLDNPNNSILGNVFCDIFNNYDQITGTDITLNPNNFVQMLVNAGNSSVLPTAPIGYGGLKIGWNCSNLTGETDFLNLANYTNAGGFNFYTMNASNLPYLIGTLAFSGLTLNGNLTNNSIVNSSGTQPYFIQVNTMPLPTTTSTVSGMGIGWNAGGAGECNLINYGQYGAGGGFNFSTITNASVNRNLALISTLANGGLRIYSAAGILQLDDRNAGAFNTQITQATNQLFINSTGINTQIVLQCGNASAVATNVMAMNTSNIQPFINFSPQSTTTFNVSHPTTTLGNNLSTNTTQYATVGFVNANSGTALLASNNTWTGNNNFYGSLRYINIGAPSNALAFGASVGNSGSIIVGDSSSLATTTTSSGNICIAPPLSSSLYTTTGSNNICVGALSGTAITTGNNNLIYGVSSGTGITTGSLNTIIGASAWPTGNFSNCTVIGASAPSPVANNSIILGRTADTVYIKGAAEINNTLMTGTTVASANFQVNGNIINPVTLYSSGVLTTFTIIPALILYTPIAGMGFVLPAPSASNSGQQFIIRRIATGGGQTINFTCTGAPAVWVNVNSGTGATSINVSTTWQLRFLSANNLFYQLA